MKKTTTTNQKAKKQWKHLSLILLLNLVTTLNSYAQTLTVIGAGAVSSGNSSNIGPIYRSTAGSAFDFSHQYYLYTAAELAAAGITNGSTIASIAFFKDNAFGTAVGNLSSVWQIHMKNTSTTPSATWSSANYNTQSTGATLVYNNTAQVIPLTTGFITLTLSTPFVYTGGSLEIGSRWDCSLFVGNPTTGGFSWKQDAITNVCFGGSAGTNAITMASQASRPQVQIGFSGPPCSGAPIGGTTTLTTIPGCGTGNFNLAVTAPAVSNVTYQWQSSSNGSTWTDLLNDTLVNLSQAPVSTLTYFRRKVTCISSTLVDSSNAVIVKPVYAGNAQATTPICGDSLTLSLNSVSAGVNSFQWLESTDNINWTPISGATLASQKIPSPIVNSYYRAVVTCNASTSTDSSASIFVKAAIGGTSSITASICLDSTTLGLTANSSGSATYNWLSSTDSITWTSMGITSVVAKFPSPTATRFYRAVVTCGAASDSSIAVRVNEPCQGFGPYSITRNTGVTYTTIQTTGNQFTWTNASGDDDYTQKVSMPFAFNYHGVNQSAFFVSTNGWLSFDTTAATNNLTNDLNSTLPRRVVAPLWEDLVTLGNSNVNKSLIRYATTGTAPNRVLTVEWAEMERFNYGSPSLNFQVKLYETSNNIELVYGRMQPFDGNGTGTFSYSTGLSGNNPASGQKIALLLENTSNFSALSLNNNLSILPLCNTSILFTNGAAFNPTNTTAIPSNDSSSAPIALTVNPIPCTDGCGTYYTSRSATASATGPAPLSGNPDDDVWFSFTAPISGQVSISLVGSSGYDPAFMVMNNLFDTAGLGNAASRNAATTALESVVASGLTFGNTYLVRVFNAGAGSGSASGAFSICVNEVIPPPLNDDTTGAFVLTPTKICTPTAGTTLGSSASPQAVCAGLADDDVWFKFTPSASVDTVTVVGSGTFRPHVQVLTRNMTSLSCQNATVNAGTVKTTLTGLSKDSTFFIRVYHTNAGGATANFTICVTGDSATLPIVTTGAPSNISDVVATLSGTIVSNGFFPLTRSGLVYSTTPSPVIGGLGVVDSTNNPIVNAGSFNKNIAGLNPLTTYYYRTYAINVLGTTYGPDSSFTTLAAPAPPSLNTVAATNITTTTARIGGSIISNGGSIITASGIVYSTNPNPVIGAPGVVDSATTIAVPSGSYFINPTGLTHSTKYYFRAYAINAGGTGYSAQDSFTSGLIINTLPYSQNFETGANGWTSIATGGANNWVLGTPAKTFLTGALSGTRAWVTSLTGQYSANHNAAVVSPVFDLTSYTSPVLRFSHKFVTEANFDALVAEVSIDGGINWTRLDSNLGTGANFNTSNSFAWYNNNGTFGPIVNNKFSSNTTGIGSNNIFASQNNGWIQSATSLGIAAGQSNVMIRFRFGSDVSGQDEGWAIDDIEIVNINTPSTAASAVNVTGITNTTSTVNWTNGNGQGRLVVARLTSAAAVAPTDNILYNENSIFNTADSTGSGNYIVYKNSGNSVLVTGLTLLTNYTYDVYEYNGKYMHIKFTSAASNNATTLPVNLTSFAVKAIDADAILSWSTSSETNNKGFDVERSLDGRNFVKVDFVKGAGNSNRNVIYKYNDAQIFNKAQVLYYRLKQVDFDGKFEYSQIIRVSKNAEKANSIVVYPNPFSKEYQVSFQANNEGIAILETVDLQGKIVANKTVSIQAGINAIPVTEVDNLKAGVYFVRVTVNGETQVMKLVKN